MRKNKNRDDHHDDADGDDEEELNLGDAAGGVVILYTVPGTIVLISISAVYY